MAEPRPAGDVVGRDVMALEGLALGSEQRPVRDGRVVEGDVEEAREDVDVDGRGQAQRKPLERGELARVEERGAVAVGKVQEKASVMMLATLCEKARSGELDTCPTLVFLGALVLMRARGSALATKA